MARHDQGAPDQGANQDDAVWLDLVARLQEESPAIGTGDADGTQHGADGAADSTPGTAPGPAPTFRDFDPLGLAGAVPPGTAATGAGDAAGGSPTLPGPRDYGVADDDDGVFVPAEPPSLAGTDPLTVLAWLGAVGGPVALLLAVLFWRSAPVLAIVGIVAAFVLGTVYLIMKLPSEKAEGDDGARV